MLSKNGDHIHNRFTNKLIGWSGGMSSIVPTVFQLAVYKRQGCPKSDKNEIRNYFFYQDQGLLVPILKMKLINNTEDLE